MTFVHLRHRRKPEALTFGERMHAVAQTGPLRGGQQARQRFRHGFTAQAEGVVVHWDHDPRADVDANLQRLFR